MTHALSAALAGSSLTMSSLEIADRTGKSHDNVLRDIRGMLTELHGDALRFEAIYRDSMNRKKPCFELPKHETLVLVTGYSIPMRAAVVARWQELEAQVAGPALPGLLRPGRRCPCVGQRVRGRAPRPRGPSHCRPSRD